MFRLLRFTGGFAAANGYLLVLPSGDSVLVDAPEGISFWPELQKVQLRGLLITHAHYDHIQDAAALANRYHCPIHAFSQPEPNLTLVALLDLEGIPIHALPFEVTTLLTESTPLALAGLNFRVLHVPGHSPDALCFLPQEADATGKHLVFSGDVLFQGSIGRTDFPQGDHSLLLQGIREKLYTLPGETVVLPGHGPATTIGEEKSGNPFVRGI